MTSTCQLLTSLPKIKKVYLNMHQTSVSSVTSTLYINLSQAKKFLSYLQAHVKYYLDQHVDLGNTMPAATGANNLKFSSYMHFTHSHQCFVYKSLFYSKLLKHKYFHTLKEYWFPLTNLQTLNIHLHMHQRLRCIKS